MQGGGGLNGRVAPPVGARRRGRHAGARPRLRGGDDRHRPRGRGVRRQLHARSAGRRSTSPTWPSGASRSAAKDVVARYYGRPAAKAYFAGCSTGGREGMLMAQRYPAYFDGIIAGAPAMRTGHSNLAVRAMRGGVQPARAAGRRRQAAARAGASPTPIARRSIQGLLDACDANDGVEGRPDLRHARVPLLAGVAGVQGRRRRTAACRRRRWRRSRRPSPGRAIRRAARSIRRSSTTPASSRRAPAFRAS